MDSVAKENSGDIAARVRAERRRQPSGWKKTKRFFTSGLFIIGVTALVVGAALQMVIG